jgi:hypothetical protein
MAGSLFPFPIIFKVVPYIVFNLERDHQGDGIKTGCGLNYLYSKYEVFRAVTMKNYVFWYVKPCGSCKDRRFGGKYRLHHQDDNNRRARNNFSSN